MHCVYVYSVCTTKASPTPVWISGEVGGANPVPWLNGFATVHSKCKNTHRKRGWSKALTPVIAINIGRQQLPSLANLAAPMTNEPTISMQAAA